MKTPEQICQWLRSQLWYEQFVRNIDRHGPILLRDKAKLIYGEEGLSTIVYAFPWNETEEGINFWDEADKQFIKWYNDEDER